MSDLREYKCPACGGAMEFDSGSQKMKCPFCDTEVSIEEFEQEQKKNPEETRWEAGNGAQWKEDEISGMAVYSCQSCGGEITADKTTGATTCPFCGNRVVLKGQFEGELRPDYIIPFKLDKKAAKAAYYKHLEKKSFLPKVFSFENHIDEIVGVYVPFWLFDVDAQAYMTYNAERIRTWRQGNKEHTEHEYYHVDRAGGIEFEHVPTDCSRKMDDALMEAIEPYDFKDAVPFQTPYLAGYVADRYDVNMEECMERATTRIRQSAEDALRETVKGYQTVTSDEKYNKAFTTFARLSDKFLNQAEKGKPYDSGHMPKGSVSPFWIFGDLAIGILIALIWGNVKKAKLKSVKKQVAAQEYTKPGSLRLTMNSDRFVNRTVTTRVIQNNNSNSSGGGSSVHNGSSGTSHGGKSGSF